MGQVSRDVLDTKVNCQHSVGKYIYLDIISIPEDQRGSNKEVKTDHYRLDEVSAHRLLMRLAQQLSRNTEIRIFEKIANENI
jgi:hypothetical protein